MRMNGLGFLVVSLALLGMGAGCADEGFTDAPLGTENAALASDPIVELARASADVQVKVQTLEASGWKAVEGEVVAHDADQDSVAFGFEHEAEHARLDLVYSASHTGETI